ncbi:MAG: DUF58 domain-containing protein [Bacillota bacterium]|nr:DUF58 domain-containing protein [Bacillota bacterium]
MKKRQAIFYGLAVLFLVAGLLSGNRIFYVLLFTQAAILVCILILNLWAVVSFTYTQELSSARTLRGRPVMLSLAIHNEKSLPFPLMRIRLIVADEHEQKDLTFNLAPDSHLSFNHEMACPYRGSYEVGMTVIDFLDLFGLLRLPIDMRLLPYYRMKQLLVYPRLIELTRLNMPALDAQRFTRHQNLTDDHEQPYAMVRKYRPGDAGKQIHWKVSMRQRQLMTRVYEQATEPDIELILDLNPGGYKGESARQTEDVFCESATALVYYLLRQNWHLLVTGYGKEIRHLSGSSLKDFQPIYQWLAAVQFDSHRNFLQQLRQDLVSSHRVRARIILTTRIEAEIGEILGQNRLSRTSNYTLVTGPARDNPSESQLAGLFHQAGLPVWFIHYGDDLTKVLQGDF